jgi:hypothetical protein
MALLRRTLYLGAAVSVIGGLAFSITPHFWLVTVFKQQPYPDSAGGRMFGVGMFTFGLLMVLVAHRIEQLWWWSWAFVIAGVGFTLVGLTRAIGDPGDSSSTMWWGVALSNAVFAGSLIWGLGRTGMERPPI